MPANGVGGVLLAPGAGSGRDHPCLRAIEAACAPIPVRRMDFAYRAEGRRAPDRAPKLLATMAGELDEFAAALACPTAEIVVGGRSMGGRMASMLAAGGDPPTTDGPRPRPAIPVAGVVLVSYPLHPPGKPDRLRIEHLRALDVPVLFVSGTRDPFASPAELDDAIGLVGGPVTVKWIDGGRHDLKGADDEVAALVADWITALGAGDGPELRQ